MTGQRVTHGQFIDLVFGRPLLASRDSSVDSLTKIIGNLKARFHCQLEKVRIDNERLGIGTLVDRISVTEL